MSEDHKDSGGISLTETLARLLEVQRRSRPSRALEESVLERLGRIEREALERAVTNPSATNPRAKQSAEPEDVVNASRAYEREGFAPIGWSVPALRGGVIVSMTEGAASSRRELRTGARVGSAPGFVLPVKTDCLEEDEHLLSLSLEYSGLTTQDTSLRVSWKLARSFALAPEDEIDIELVGLLVRPTMQLIERSLRVDAELAHDHPDGFDPRCPDEGEFSLLEADLGFAPEQLALARLTVKSGDSL